MKRVVIPELLDTDAGTPEEVQASLRDLQWFNRYFGGEATTASLLKRIAKRSGKRELRVLDVAGASSDGTQMANTVLGNSGITLRTYVVDRAISHLPRNGVTSHGIAADALALPFQDGSFDVVGSSLFAHHLEPDELQRFVRSALRIANVAVFINDLRRSKIHWLTAILGKPLYRSRLTQHDAPASVKRAYTPSELLALLRAIPAARIELIQRYFYRMGVIIWR